jgi:hypothetical protein
MRNPSGIRGGVLFIRSSPVPQALAHLVATTERHAGPVAVLTGAAAADVFARCGLVSDVHTYDEGVRISLGSVPVDTVSALAARGFERAVISCATRDGSGYDNVVSFARACRIPSIVLMLPSLAERHVERARVARTVTYAHRTEAAVV